MLVGRQPTSPWPARVLVRGDAPRTPRVAAFSRARVASPQPVASASGLQPAVLCPGSPRDGVARRCGQLCAIRDARNPSRVHVPTTAPLDNPDRLSGTRAGDGRRLPGRGVLSAHRPSSGRRLDHSHPPTSLSRDGHGRGCVRIRSLRVGLVSARQDWRVRRLAGMSGRWSPAFAATVALLFISGCGLIGGPSTVLVAVPNTITVTSPDFNGKQMSSAFSCRGPGKSPAIHWSGAPAGTKSLALVMDDSAAPIKPYIYWIVFDIGPQSSDIPAGQLPPR